ncbi:MAG: threonine synthase [Candidatus ainarchaeum sp.]|nr:threonine synthase [Candidatus ainarchaeum sp.]
MKTLQKQMLFHSTNDRNLKVTFQKALMDGQAPNYGLYMIDRQDVPKLSPSQIGEMKSMNYAQIATAVLTPYLKDEIEPATLAKLMEKAYDPGIISVEMQHLAGRAHILWLTKGPTYSFKDYAGRFYGVVLDHFLGISGRRKTILIATSGDTGGALGHSLQGLENVDVVIFYPKGKIREGQRRQMTTLWRNVHAVAVNGNFDNCQDIVKCLLNDRRFAQLLSDDPERFGSANSISLGRLLPQAVYPFYAYSRIANGTEPFVASIPSGNFGDMMGTILAKEMGLPVLDIICALNGNRGFLDYLQTGTYEARDGVENPSSAMDVGHPNNLARLVHFYGGHMFDRVEGGKVQKGVIDVAPDLELMNMDITAVSVTKPEHYPAMAEAYQKYKVLLDPHGAVGYMALERSLAITGATLENSRILSVIYETADPGKFPKIVKKATGVMPPIPLGMQKQAKLPERIYDIENGPDIVDAPDGKKTMQLSARQIREAKATMHLIFSGV